MLFLHRPWLLIFATSMFDRLSRYDTLIGERVSEGAEGIDCGRGDIGSWLWTDGSDQAVEKCHFFLFASKTKSSLFNCVLFLLKESHINCVKEITLKLHQVVEVYFWFSWGL